MSLENKISCSLTIFACTSFSVRYSTDMIFKTLKNYSSRDTITLKKHFLGVRSETKAIDIYCFAIITISVRKRKRAADLPKSWKGKVMAAAALCWFALDKESIAMANYVLCSSVNVKITIPWDLWRPSQDSELLVLIIFHAPEPLLPCLSDNSSISLSPYL